jgi:hypothetical protein
MVITCPRAKTDMTPCVARDGKAACTGDGKCVGCAHHPADLLTDLVARYVEVTTLMRSGAKSGRKGVG